MRFELFTNTCHEPNEHTNDVERLRVFHYFRSFSRLSNYSISIIDLILRQSVHLFYSLVVFIGRVYQRGKICTRCYALLSSFFAFLFRLVLVLILVLVLVLFLVVAVVVQVHRESDISTHTWTWFCLLTSVVISCHAAQLECARTTHVCRHWTDQLCQAAEPLSVSSPLSSEHFSLFSSYHSVVSTRSNNLV